MVVKASSRGWTARSALAIGAALALSALCAPASAQDLEEARRLYLQAEFQEAEAAFQAVLDSPGLNAEEAVEAHRYLSALHTMLGNNEQAEQHAAAAVALDPAVSAPEGSPTTVPALFESARAATGGRTARLRIEAQGTLLPEQAARVAARLDPAPSFLAQELQLRCASGPESAEERGAPPEVTVELPARGENVVCRASAHTRGGATLFSERADLAVGGQTGGATSGPAREEPGEEEPASSSEEGGVDVGWVVFGVVLGLAAAAGAGVAVALTLDPGPQSASLGAPRVEGW